MKTLLKYKKEGFGQKGTDGITAEVVKRLGIERGWFVDVGAWDGKYISNTYQLLLDGWNGVEIECNDVRWWNLIKNTVCQPRFKRQEIYPILALVKHNDLENYLRPTHLPKDFDLLNIDVDSWDYWIWKNMTDYSAKIVIIEVDGRPLGEEFIQPPDRPPIPTVARVNGASFTSMLKLAQKKGYRLACHCGNMFFVRNDWMDKLNLPKEELDNPDSLYIDGKDLL